MKNELQSLGMIKVELAAVLEMSKRNEEGIFNNNYMKNEALVF